MTLPATPRTRLKRHPERGHHDASTVNAILDEGLVCHVSTIFRGSPITIPTAYARIDDQLYVHGSTANRLMRALRDGAEACVTVTILDGLVLSRSAFHTSMNFRSVVIFGQAREVEDPIEKEAAFRALIEHVAPGRWKDIRPPDRNEFLQAMVLAVPIQEASAKVRTGPPVEEEADYQLGCWAGVVPLACTQSAPLDDGRVPAETRIPPYAARWAETRCRS